jgi:hypothetical protein
MRYDVSSPPGEVPVVRSAWFARELPGPPVYMEERKGDIVATRMVLIENRVDADPDR